MKKKLIQILISLLALAVFPNMAYAQDMTFDEDEVEEDEGEMSFSEDEAEGEVLEEEPAPEPETTDADIESALGGEIGAALGVEDPAESAEGEVEISDQDRHPIWAVQQVYALRARRLDLQPSFGFSMNDPYVSHYAISAAASYYITEVLAVGLSFNFYRGLNAQQDTNFSLRRATHQAVPINEYFWGGQLNFTYVPVYGKFTMLKEWILHWDVWVVGGGGFIFTRPIPTIDPDYREFDFEIKFAFNVGIGGRMFLTRFLAIYLELRDYIFPEELESTQVFASVEDRQNENNWLDDEHKITNNIMMHVGVSIFFPFTFEYKLPK